MNNQDTIKLIKTAYSKDAYGVQTPTETFVEIFAHIQSVSGTEVFEAGKNGIKAVYRFDIYDFEYNGEQTVEYHGERYQVYRTYRATLDVIELYVQKVGGA